MKNLKKTLPISKKIRSKVNPRDLIDHDEFQGFTAGGKIAYFVLGVVLVYAVLHIVIAFV